MKAFNCQTVHVVFGENRRRYESFGSAMESVAARLKSILAESHGQEVGVDRDLLVIAKAIFLVDDEDK